MSFFKKSKKAPSPGSGLPPAARDIVSREGPQKGSPSASASSAQFGPPSEQGGLLDTTQPRAPAMGQVQPRSTQSPTPDGRLGAPRVPAANAALDVKAGRSPLHRQPDSSLYPWSNDRMSFVKGQNPFPRYGSAVNSVASVNGEIYMLGGLIDGSMVKGDLWIVETATSPVRCYEIETFDNGPGPRVGHASLLAGNAFVVFGGDTKLDETDVLDDSLYLLNTGKYGHTLNIIGSKIYVFGGQVEGYFFNDLVSFDLTSLQKEKSGWETVFANSIDGGPPPGQMPPARTNHSIVTFDNQLYLFGGTDGQHWFNDVWTFDPQRSSWFLLDCIGYIPAAREGHAATLVGDVMYVFGGRTEEGKDLGDVAGFRITQRRWYTFQNMGPSPSPRSGHGMASFGTQIFVIGGEPSSVARNPAELSDIYTLETAKIRYPEDKPGQQKIAGRRPSVTDKSGAPQAPGLLVGPNGRPLATKMSQESMGSGPSAQEIGLGSNGMRSARIAPSPVSSGPPPQQALPQPLIKANGIRGASQEATLAGGESPRMLSKVERVLGMSSSRDNMAIQGSPGSNRQGPFPPASTQNKSYSPNLGVAGVNPSGANHRQQGSQDSTNRRMAETPDPAARAGEDLIQSSFKGPVYPDSGIGSSPALSSGQNTAQTGDAWTKELDTLRQKNAWFASELALARKEGYFPSSSDQSALLADDKTAEAVGEEEKPLLEALLRMKSELAKVQESLASQSAVAAEKIAQSEREKEVALAEALHARQQLSTQYRNGAASPALSLGGTDEAGRRLAAALAAQSTLQQQITSLQTALTSERKARALSEESSAAAHARAMELDDHKTTSTTELEKLRRELAQAQQLHRQHSTAGADAISASRMLELDKQELSSKLEAALEAQRGHATVLTSLHSAVTSSTSKTALLESQLEQERQGRATLEEKLSKLRSDYEARVVELEAVSRRLKDAEDIAESHANEAKSHREVVLAGFAKLGSHNNDVGGFGDERVAHLQRSLSESQTLAQQHREAADSAESSLLSLQERIHDLETAHQKSIREGLGLRKQLEGSSLDALTLQSTHSELQEQLSKHKLELATSQMQHQALRGLLVSQGVDVSQIPSDLDEAALRGDGSRLKQLEEQLHATNRSHEEVRAAFEQREAELRKTRDAEYHALEQECQQMREYIEGFHDVAEKLKKNIKKEKAENLTLREELEREKSSSTSAKANPDSAAIQVADFESERTNFRHLIEDLQSQVTVTQTSLDSQVKQLSSAIAERDSAIAETSHYREQLANASNKSQSDVEALRAHNAELEQRANEAERKVHMLLDTVGNSVDNYRRQSARLSVNGIAGHSRGPSAASIGLSNPSPHHSKNNSVSGPALGALVERHEFDGTNGNPADRSSAVFDSFATELDNLRKQWETTSRSYNHRLSERSLATDQSDALAALTAPAASGASGSAVPQTSNSMTDWRRRLDLEEDEEDVAAGRT